MARPRRRRRAAVVACVLAVAILLPLGARAASSRWHDDSLWANSLRSLGGQEVPFDLAVFLLAAEDVRSGDSPYVEPEDVSEDAPAPYVYPPLLAIVLVPATLLPDDVGGSSPVGVLISLLLVGCIVGALLRQRSRTSNTAPLGRCWFCSSHSGGVTAIESARRPRQLALRSC